MIWFLLFVDVFLREGVCLARTDVRARMCGLVVTMAYPFATLEFRVAFSKNQNPKCFLLCKNALS